MDINCTIGFRPQDARLVSLLYNETFGQYFKLAVPNSVKRAALLQQFLEPNCCVAAYLEEHLLGVLGFAHLRETLIKKVSLCTLIKNLGFLSGLWAAFVLKYVRQKPRPDELLVIGLAIDPQCRGIGVGQQLLRCLIQHARTYHYNRIRIEFPAMTEAEHRFFIKQGFVQESISLTSRMWQLLYWKKVTCMVMYL
ncbi:GNAT family N-acetyltransferase [Hydromonas duriensis]|uniref:Acetyltransferase (GNAT) family protein n=1 Tax=Hydromonas duriensis TaxID=1527608 RepID=A0A4R6YBC8_9BURK|nr:GNAT family N-acetyltransferase [Hydromonas duriensis]TDR32825.1 acetyltransferase (GNAT) family protein [Hydromonas duriensis]